MTKEISTQELTGLVGPENTYKLMTMFVNRIKQEESYAELLRTKRGVMSSFQQLLCKCGCDKKCPDIIVAMELNFIWNDEQPNEDGILLDIAHIFYTDEHDYTQINAHYDEYLERKNVAGSLSKENKEMISVYALAEKMARTIDPTLN